MIKFFREIWRTHRAYISASQQLKNMQFAGDLSDAIEELGRWRIQWEEHRRWMAEFRPVATVLDNMRAEARGLNCDGAPVTRHEFLSDLRELMRAQRAADDSARLLRYLRANEAPLWDIVGKLRNPHGHDEETLRKARLAAAGILDPRGANFRCMRCTAWCHDEFCSDCGRGVKGITGDGSNAQG